MIFKSFQIESWSKLNIIMQAYSCCHGNTHTQVLGCFDALEALGQ